MFVEFSGFITLKNLDFKRNMLIIYFFIFFPFDQKKIVIEKIGPNTRTN